MALEYYLVSSNSACPSTQNFHVNNRVRKRDEILKLLQAVGIERSCYSVNPNDARAEDFLTYCEKHAKELGSYWGSVRQYDNFDILLNVVYTERGDRYLVKKLMQEKEMGGYKL